MNLALELRAIHKRFGAVMALEGANLAVRPGTVHALLGENGAGKTTLMRVAFGMLAPDAGEVVVQGVPRTRHGPAAALAGGIGMVHQHFTLVPAMTVAENVSLGGTGRWARGPAEARVRALGARTGLAVEPSARVRDLPVGAQQRVEILKAVARDVRVLVLDEPTAVLAPPEADGLLRWMRDFVGDGQRAVVLITHKLREAAQVADDVTVLRHGRAVLQSAGGEATEPVMVRAMLGDEGRGALRNAPSPGGAVRGDAVLSLLGATVRGAGERLLLHPTTCHVHAGEIVGVAAVEGAGHHELLRLLAGRLRATEGEVRIPANVAFIPEDRHRDASVGDFSLTENMALRGLAHAPSLSWEAMSMRTRTAMERFDVRASGADDTFRSLSGGNQQRFVLARELDPFPPAVVAENPTRGLDVRATAAVFAELRRAAAAGVGVVVYSTDLDEVLAVADRIWVVHDGRVHETSGHRDEIGRLMIGAA